ncbi:aminotransferase class I/II-fold pyridoxal phosphate-dependent enzyme [Georgenia sp. TF02-10]|uniref:aminotransferase class I/II-fold pyridoxal phosphate-dependent enzyme n=1 Tax=Georgenia sp. TF02-10 TaxID=2917725 RepID=UPI001FA7C681|nr:aminotransferase class I/II-fold pyridoxal phosphate-dependent enzyme [Georgenia sp. TF02-10]UNX54761.1 aminotransferase class I/II-fold pyridoxal phosphate-dependent enzyme [Georgenia sp. TF02-10]
MTDPHPLAAHGHWQDVARATGLLGADGTVASTIFAEMSALAERTGAINLGQGFPDAPGPAHLRAAAMAAVDAGHNQYPPGPGIPALRAAVAAHQRRHYGLEVDPETEVLVTAGATEALAASVLALAGPGDEVVTLEPFYDSYAAVIALAGATHRTVPLRPGPRGFRLDAADVDAAVGPRTRLLLVNSPHNPTGIVLTPDELGLLGRAAAAADAVVLTDEVYEHLTYGPRHVPMATLPGLAGRTLTVSSAGKTLAVTGWKVGWVHGPAALVTAVRTVKQFLTYVASGPFQHAVAAALDDADGATARYVADQAAALAGRRDVLLAGLRAGGFVPVAPEGTYFVVADGAPLGYPDAVDLCRELPGRAGVVAIPVSAFCTPGGAVARALASWVRFTYVKSEPLVAEAARRLAALGD